MKLIIGLGNYGKQYNNTRHNIGFMLLDYIANKKNYTINNNGFNSVDTKITIKGEKVIIIKPLTYMNNSGQAIRAYMNYYNIDKEDILVIQDDKDMEFMKLKIVKNSSSGGHNGIKSIESHLKSKDYMRLKIGIDSKYNKDTASFVLDKFSKEELSIIEKNFEFLIDLIEDFVEKDYQALTTKYNGKI